MKRWSRPVSLGIILAISASVQIRAETMANNSTIEQTKEAQGQLTKEQLIEQGRLIEKMRQLEAEKIRDITDESDHESFQSEFAKELNKHLVDGCKRENNRPYFEGYCQGFIAAMKISKLCLHDEYSKWSKKELAYMVGAHLRTTDKYVTESLGVKLSKALTDLFNCSDSSVDPLGIRKHLPQ